MATNHHCTREGYADLPSTEGFGDGAQLNASSATPGEDLLGRQTMLNLYPETPQIMQLPDIVESYGGMFN